MPNYTPYISKDFVIEGSMLSLKDKEKAWEAIDGRHRTSVRKAQKSDAIIKKVKGTPKEIKEFCAFCLNPDDIPARVNDGKHHLYFAYLGKELIAGIMLVEIGDVLFMLCHASTPKAKDLGVPSFLIWHAVEEFTGSKFRAINIGASYRPSLQNFFQGWATHRYPVIMKPPELKPQLLLTPFDNDALGKEPLPNAIVRTKESLEKKCGKKPMTFFPRGMYAIFTLIKFLKLKKNDEVCITTTTDAHYVSSCVTSAIEKTAKVSRKLSKNTKAIFVIHEFGFLHPKLKELRKEADKRKIPLIEDCAYAWHTKNAGTTGDYVIYSFTKAFPVQFGGILVGQHFSHKELWDEYGCSDGGKEEYTHRHLAHWLDEDTSDIRRSNYDRYVELFGEERTFFPLEKDTVPGAYVLRMENEKNMQSTSQFVRSFGIECGNYWKSSAIILPVHQRLTREHIDYIAGSVFATERKWCGVPDHP